MIEHNTIGGKAMKTEHKGITVETTTPAPRIAVNLDFYADQIDYHIEMFRKIQTDGSIMKEARINAHRVEQALEAHKGQQK